MSTRAHLTWAFVILVANAFVLSSCRDQPSTTVTPSQTVLPQARETALIDGYYSSNIVVAETSLLGLAELYSSSQFENTAGVKGTIAMVHTRLHLLYVHAGRTNEAAVHQAKALELFRADNPSVQERWNELLQAVDALDRNRTVTWKIPR
jgi:hypothetical protein